MPSHKVQSDARYPLFPTERPVFYVTTTGYTENTDGTTLSFEFEDEEAASACARYDAMDIVYELVFNVVEGEVKQDE